MTLDGAVVNQGGVTFALAAVPPAAVKDAAEAGDLLATLERDFFPGLPVVLMSRDWYGKPHYYGDIECSRVMHGVHVSRIPWTRYTVS